MSILEPEDPEFYDALDAFVEDLIVSLPTSYDAAIDALEEKARDLRKKLDTKEN